MCLLMFLPGPNGSSQSPFIYIKFETFSYLWACVWSVYFAIAWWPLYLSWPDILAISMFDWFLSLWWFWSLYWSFLPTEWVKCCWQSFEWASHGKLLDSNCLCNSFEVWGLDRSQGKGFRIIEWASEVASRVKSLSNDQAIWMCWNEKGWCLNSLEFQRKRVCCYCH